MGSRFIETLMRDPAQFGSSLTEAELRLLKEIKLEPINSEDKPYGTAL